MCEEFLKHMTEDCLYKLTKHRIEKLIKCLNKVYREKYRSKYKPRKTFRAFTDEEVERFFSAINRDRQEKYYVAWRIMQLLGLRPNEVRKLKIDDLNRRERLLNVVNWKCDERKMFKPLSENLCSFISEYIDNHFTDIYLSDGYLFPSENGNSKTPYVSHGMIRNAFARIRKRARLPSCVGQYSFRKYYANKVYEISGGNSKLVQDSLGHADFSTTANHYLETTLVEHRVVNEQLALNVCRGVL